MLALVLLISFLVWRLIEYNMRRYAKENNKDLSGWKKRRTKQTHSFYVDDKLPISIDYQTWKSQAIRQTLVPNSRG